MRKMILFAVIVVVAVLLVEGSIILKAANTSHWQVVVEVLPAAYWTFELTPPLSGSDAAMGKQMELYHALAAAQTKSPIPGMSIVIREGIVHIQTLARTSGETSDHNLLVQQAMKAVFGAGKFRIAPWARSSKPFRQADLNRDLAIYVVKERFSDARMKCISSSGKDPGRIIFTVSGTKLDRQRLARLLQIARWKFLLLPKDFVVQGDSGDGNPVVISRKSGKPVSASEIIHASYPVVADEAVGMKAKVTVGMKSTPAVSFSISKPQVLKVLDRNIANYSGRTLAVMLDEKIIIAPTITKDFKGSGIISGLRTQQEAIDLATVLNSGTITFPMKIVSINEVAASRK